MAQTLGWLSLPAAFASERKRARAVSSAASVSASSLIATSRSISGSCAFSTMPMPPRPSTPVIWYFPSALPTQARADSAREAAWGASVEVAGLNPTVSPNDDLGGPTIGCTGDVSLWSFVITTPYMGQPHLAPLSAAPIIWPLAPRACRGARRSSTMLSLMHHVPVLNDTSRN